MIIHIPIHNHTYKAGENYLINMKTAKNILVGLPFKNSAGMDVGEVIDVYEINKHYTLIEVELIESQADDLMDEMTSRLFQVKPDYF